MTFSCRTEVVGDTPVLQAQGEIDVATIATWRDQLLRLVTRHPGARVAVDLDGVAVLDDAALGVLLGAAGRARETGGDLVVVCTSPRLLDRFARTRLDRAVEIHPRLA